MGARSLIDHPATRTPVKRPTAFAAKRPGSSPTAIEQSIVTQFVQDQSREVTERQVAALSTLLRRGKDVVRKMIQQAREDFQSHAEFYVNAHRQAVETALTTLTKDGEPDAKALDAAMRGSQWAMENLSAEGERIVDKQKESGGPSGPQILVGINLGGKNERLDDSVAARAASLQVAEGVVEEGSSSPEK